MKVYECVFKLFAADFGIDAANKWKELYEQGRIDEAEKFEILCRRIAAKAKAA